MEDLCTAAKQRQHKNFTLARQCVGRGFFMVANESDTKMIKVVMCCRMCGAVCCKAVTGEVRCPA